MPDATGLELIAQELRDADAEAVLETLHFRGRSTIIVEPSKVGWALERLRARGFDFLASVHGVDYYPEEPRLGVHYELLDMQSVDRLTVKLRVHTEAPEVPSVTPEWPTADHQEREIYDMFGVVFDGHPDLRDPHARGLRGLPAAARLPGRRRARPLHLQRRARNGLHAMSASLDVVSPGAAQQLDEFHPEPEQELLTINFGPHHPATHGVLRLMITLEGEVVRDTKPIIGYVHTGIEKTAEDKSYWKAIPAVERMDYLAYYFNAYAFCGAVEALLDLEVPKYAQYLRVIHLELNRIKSHLVWLGTSALDLGAISMFWYCFREREQILDLFEMSSGQRMHTRYIQVGGVAEDIPPGWEERCRQFTQLMRKRADEYGALLNRNEIVL
ncbi:MAG TPA: NADH-quinone oxidoreductase subunit C, partial [Actinomycetota bacterium]|nr:NADH-quinone oxidoreductase subunit C [Actinomycetota bacterium]